MRGERTESEGFERRDRKERGRGGEAKRKSSNGGRGGSEYSRSGGGA